MMQGTDSGTLNVDSLKSSGSSEDEDMISLIITSLTITSLIISSSNETR